MVLIAKVGKSKLLDTILKDEVVKLPGQPDEKPSTFINEKQQSSLVISQQTERPAPNPKQDVSGMAADDWFSRIRILPAEDLAIPELKTFGPVNCLYRGKHSKDIHVLGDSNRKLQIQVQHLQTDISQAPVERK